VTSSFPRIALPHGVSEEEERLE